MCNSPLNYYKILLIKLDTIIQLIHIKNQVRIQKELIRLLLKGLYLLQYDKELIFDTG